MTFGLRWNASHTRSPGKSLLPIIRAGRAKQGSIRPQYFSAASASQTSDLMNIDLLIYSTVPHLLYPQTPPMLSASPKNSQLCQNSHHSRSNTSANYQHSKNDISFIVQVYVEMVFGCLPSQELELCSNHNYRKMLTEEMGRNWCCLGPEFTLF